MMTEYCCAILRPAAPLIGWSAAGVWTIHWHHHRPPPHQNMALRHLRSNERDTVHLKKTNSMTRCFLQIYNQVRGLTSRGNNEWGVRAKTKKCEAQFENKSYYIGASNSSWMSHLQLKNNSKGLWRWVSVTVTQRGQDKHGGEGYGHLYACNRRAPMCTEI